MNRKVWIYMKKISKPAIQMFAAVLLLGMACGGQAAEQPAKGVPCPLEAEARVVENPMEMQKALDDIKNKYDEILLHPDKTKTLKKQQAATFLGLFKYVISTADPETLRVNAAEFYWLAEGVDSFLNYMLDSYGPSASRYCADTISYLLLLVTSDTVPASEEDRRTGIVCEAYLPRTVHFLQNYPASTYAEDVIRIIEHDCFLDASSIEELTLMSRGSTDEPLLEEELTYRLSVLKKVHDGLLEAAAVVPVKTWKKLETNLRLLGDEETAENIAEALAQ